MARRVELFDQTAAAVESVERYFITRHKTFDPEVEFLFRALTKERVVGLALAADIRGHRVVGIPEPAGVLTCPVITLQVPESVRQVHVIRKRARLVSRVLRDVFDNRSHRRPVRWPRVNVGTVLGRSRPLVAGLDVVTGVVVVVRMRHRPDDCQAVRHLGGAMQVLADPQAGGSRADRLKRTAYLFGRFGLHIQRFQLARPAEQIDEQNGLRAPGRELSAWCESVSRYKLLLRLLGRQ